MSVTTAAFAVSIVFFGMLHERILHYLFIFYLFPLIRSTCIDEILYFYFSIQGPLQVLRLQLPDNRQAVSEETHGTHTQLSVAVAALAIAYKEGSADALLPNERKFDRLELTHFVFRGFSRRGTAPKMLHYIFLSF